MHAKQLWRSQPGHGVLEQGEIKRKRKKTRVAQLGELFSMDISKFGISRSPARKTRKGPTCYAQHYNGYLATIWPLRQKKAVPSSDSMPEYK